MSETTHENQQKAALHIAGMELGHDWFGPLREKFADGADGAVLRPLTTTEINLLEAHGNTSPDWRMVLVSKNFLPGSIHGSTFLGGCVLGRFEGVVQAGESTPLPSGIYHSTISAAIIDAHVAVHRCPLVAGYRILESSVVLASVLEYHRDATCGVPLEISPGIETGGRPVVLTPDSTLAAINAQIGNGTSRDEVRDGTAQEPHGSTRRSPLGLVGPSALISSARVVDSAVGQTVVVGGAQLVENSTLCGTREERTEITSGAIVRSSILQPGTSVRDGAIVDHSLLMEHAHTDRHAKVAGSIIGPDSSVSEGEVTASYVGPFVGFHHQALLIAALWPDGKGNVGYGANVGSNHTSRLPDQEIRPGEGMFFGLGCNVKFPADFSAAPYTIIATGLSTLPQRMSMPFSLLSEPARRDPSVPLGYCRIQPGWVLSDDLYMVWRNRSKYRDRRRASRNPVEWEIFRPDIVELMKSAVRALERSAAGKKIHLPGDIPEIGKSFLLEGDRDRAIETYRFFIDFAETMRDVGRVESGADPSDVDLTSGRCERYLAALEKVVEKILVSRQKDDARGMRIIDDYNRTHPPADKDAVVVDAQRWAGQEAERVARIVGRIDG